MLTPTIIVAEQGEVWLAALRTCLRRSATPGFEPVWLHLPERDDVAAAIGRVGAAFVVLEVSRPTAARDVLQLDQWRETAPAACFVAAIDRHQEASHVRDLVLTLREAGAAHVLISPRRALEALPLLQRHWQRTSASADHGDASWNGQMQILTELPPCWKLEEARVN